MPGKHPKTFEEYAFQRYGLDPTLPAHILVRKFNAHVMLDSQTPKAVLVKRVGTRYLALSRTLRFHEN